MKKIIMLSLSLFLIFVLGCTLNKNDSKDEKEVYEEILKKINTEAKNYYKLNKFDTFTYYIADGIYIYMGENIYYYSFEDLFSLTGVQTEDLLFKLAIAGPKGNVNIVYGDRTRGIFEFKSLDDVINNGENITFDGEEEAVLINGERKKIKNIPEILSNKIVVKEIIEVNVNTVIILFDNISGVDIGKIFLKAVNENDESITSVLTEITGVNTLTFTFGTDLNTESNYKFYSNGIYFGKKSEELNKTAIYYVYNSEIRLIANKKGLKEIFGIKTFEYYISIESKNEEASKVEISVESEGKSEILKTSSIISGKLEIQNLYIPDFVTEFKIIIKNNQNENIGNGCIISIKK